MIFPDIGYISDKGNIRKENQDRVVVHKKNGCCLCAVCDGMGGTENGAMASDIAARGLSAWWISVSDRLDKLSRQEITDIFYETIMNINDAVVRCCEVQKIKAGTTLTALLIVDSFGLIAYSGDTRLYKIRGRQIGLITEDETLYRYYESYEDEAENTEKNRSVLISYIGRKANLAINLVEEEVMAGDIYVICSDGAYNYLSFDSKENVERLKNIPPEELVKEFAADIKKQRASDNLSIIIVKCR